MSPLAVASAYFLSTGCGWGSGAVCHGTRKLSPSSLSLYPKRGRKIIAKEMNNEDHLRGATVDMIEALRWSVAVSEAARGGAEP